MRRRLAAPVLALVVLTAAAVVAAPIQKVKAPDFSFQGPGGSQIRLSDLRGSVVLLIFYSAGCPHCRAEMRALPEAWDSCEAARESHVVMVGVSGDADFDRSLYEQVRRNNWYFVEGPDVAANYGFRYVPTLVVVSPDGYLWQTFVGETDPSEICAAAAEALNSSQAGPGGGGSGSTGSGTGAGSGGAGSTGGSGGLPTWSLVGVAAAAVSGASAVLLLRRGSSGGRGGKKAKKGRKNK